MPPFSAQVDLAAITGNVARLREIAAPAQMLSVVKADGYGHGMLPSAQAALAGGADWLGVAFIDEALTLRAAGITAPVLAWLLSPTSDVAAATLAEVDIAVSAQWALDLAAVAAEATGKTVRVHLKADTGLGRGGAPQADWPALCRSASALVADGRVDVVGVWSHLANADIPGHPSVQAQRLRYEEALTVATDAGLRPQLRHLANTPATLCAPETHYDLVRVGIATYGLSPSPAIGSSADLGLRPAMRLRAEVALAKSLPAGAGLSYGHRYTTAVDTRVVLVPLGYADGIPRHATNAGPVSIGGRRYQVSGTVCMDQFVVDVGPDSDIDVGDDVVIFGPGDNGEPTADDWAAAIGTINYEIVTRVGARVPRSYEGSA